VEGKGESIVFLHGWPMHSGLWKAQVEHLKADYRVITLDWLGFGQSDKPKDLPYTFTQHKECLDAVLTSVLGEEEKVTLVGHDIGGPPAILWASEHPNRVRRLILLNTVVYLFKTPLDMLSELALETPILRDIFVSRLGLYIVMKILSRNRSKETKERLQEVIRPYKELKSEVKWKTILLPLKVGRQEEMVALSNQFKELKIDKHIIIARKDPLCYAHIKRLSEDNPEVPTHFIEHSGHFISIDRPKELNKVLTEILAK